ncbi:MAG: hypothetical protein NTY20_01735 [Candidatus Aenigmarchaeota archaeon]|nr:hypothetical protein [Candidatus Aenigmarchaeota archaeon]
MKSGSIQMKTNGSNTSLKGITIFLFSEKDYARKMENIMLSTSSAFSRICYVSLNKPYSVISESLKKQGIDTKKFFFIDCTENHADEKAGQVVNVSSPKALTEMSITIGKVLELGKIEAMVFDSLSTLLVYEDPSTVVKFTHSLISSLRGKKVSGVLVCLEGGKGTGLIKDISMFADRVVR